MSGAKIGQINDLSAYKIEANIDEHYIDRVRQDLDATFERQSSVFDLVVSKVYPEVRNGQFKTDFCFSGEKPDNIRTGQTYYINLELGQPTQAVIIPQGRLLPEDRGDMDLCFIYRRGQSSKRSIRIGRQNPQYYEVLEGLEPGEKVIVSSYEKLRKTTRS
jgi:HlyD family secretion protein